MVEEIDADKQCSHVFPEDDPQGRGGQRCEGFHIQGSPYCMGHSERRLDISAAHTRKAEAARKLKEELEEYQNTKSRADVQNLTEKIINGILQGHVNKNKAGQLGVFIPIAYKMAKELEHTTGGGTGVQFQIKERSMNLEMSEELMDAYLGADESVKVEILEDLQKKGKIKYKKKKGKVTLSGNVKPEDVKTDCTTIAEISEKTDVPVTRKQALKIFGKTMADKPDVKPCPDMTGFGELFAKRKGKPTGLPDEAVHKFKGKYESNLSTGLAKLWFTCQQCGKRVPNVNRELCPAGGKQEAAK